MIRNAVMYHFCNLTNGQNSNIKMQTNLKSLLLYKSRDQKPIFKKPGTFVILIRCSSRSNA